MADAAKGTDERKNLEYVLCSGSTEKSVSDVLDDLAGVRKVRVELLADMQAEAGGWYDMLATYADGTAFTWSRPRNLVETTHHYFLHRNDEHHVYRIEPVDVPT